MKSCLSICLTIATCVSLASAQPRTFDQIVAFGDSLSDAGNLQSPSTKGYFDGRWSNGPNWLDRLAERVRAARPMPSQLGGKNYAWAAATARDDLNWFFDIDPNLSVPSIPDQVAEFIATGAAHNNQLFSVWAGHNDIWAKYGDDRDVEESVNAFTSQLTILLDEGVSDLLVSNLSVHQRIGADVVPEFNLRLAERIAELRMNYPAASIYEFDYSAFLDAIVAEPALFGITEPIAPACVDCYLGDGPGETFVPNPDEHFFWDDAHISAKGNQLLADAVYRQFFAVPEPSGYVIVISLLLLAGATSNQLRSGRRNR